jgi:TATA-box binding protein (TBP) (component of TFIID and TFIIIB)
MVQFATNYRVSTITANGSVGKNVGELDLNILFDVIIVINKDDVDSNQIGFIYIVDREGKQMKGVSPRKEKKTHLKKLKEEDINKKRRFDNAISGYFKTKNGYYPSVKIFKNGTIQMTGLKKVDDAVTLHKQVFGVFESLTKEHPNIIKNSNNVQLECCNFFIRLINSDFSVPYLIRRKDLHQLLISDTYNITSSFQPGTYPGVKIQYCWNLAYPNNNGRCCCTQKCFGKGNGNGEGQCKKITISIFESGKILLTGAVNFDQIDKSYEYISDILYKYKDLLEKRLPQIKITTQQQSSEQTVS